MKQPTVLARLRTPSSSLFFLALILQLQGPLNAHSPHDVVDVLELSPNFSEDQTLFVGIVYHLRRSTDGGYTWKELTRGLDYKSPITDIAVSPGFKDDQTLFISLERDGIYRSRDRGDSWTSVNQGLTTLEIASLVFSSVDHRTLLAGAGGRLFRSTDGGDSWALTFEGSNTITDVIFTEAGRALAATAAGEILLTEDSGKSWSVRGQSQDTGGFTSLLHVKNSAGEALYVGTENAGVIRSPDLGATFSRSSSELPESIIALAAPPAHGESSQLFASTWHEAVFVSNDHGEHWKKQAEGLTKSRQADEPRYRSPHFRAMRFSNGFAQDRVAFLAGFNGLFKSMDGGTTWIDLETLPIALLRSLDVGPGDAVIVGTYGGGVYLTGNDGSSWMISNIGLYRTRLSDTVFSPDFANDKTIFGGSLETLLKSTNGGHSWQQNSLSGLTWNTRYRYSYAPRFLGLRHFLTTLVYPTRIVPSPDFKEDQTVFYGTRWTGLYCSTDGGKTSSRLWDSMGRIVPELVISPAFRQDRTLFASVRGLGVFKSVDAGKTWSACNTGFDFLEKWKGEILHALSVQDVILSVSPAFDRDATVFAGTSEGLFKTTNRGASWQRSGSNLSADDFVISLGLSPNYEVDRTVLLSIRGKGLFKSTDAGDSFQAVGESLLEQNEAIELISFSPDYPKNKKIYCASDENLFRSVDGGLKWRRIGRPVRYENKRDVVRYTGNWEKTLNPRASASDFHHSNEGGAEVALRFVGTGIAWVGSKGPSLGIAQVFIDGDLYREVDQFAEQRQNVATNVAVNGLPRGVHEIRVIVMEDKNPLSAGHRIEVDAFDVTP